MSPTQLTEFKERCTDLAYPIDREAAAERIGEQRIAAPTGAVDRVGDVLDRCGATRFESADDLYASVAGHLSAAHVGRRYYDDRGTNHRSTGALSF